MEEEKRHHHHSHQNNAPQAFLFGIIIGAALALLFTTKKGRRILRTLTSEGMEKIERWEELLYKKAPPPVAEVDAIDEMTVASEYVPSEVAKNESHPHHVSQEAVKHSLKEQGVTSEPPKPSGVRRFFKGAKK
jgi:gas vesicle protein